MDSDYILYIPEHPSLVGYTFPGSGIQFYQGSRLKELINDISSITEGKKSFYGVGLHYVTAEEFVILAIKYNLKTTP